jgi:hypothetical protein
VLAAGPLGGFPSLSLQIDVIQLLAPRDLRYFALARAAASARVGDGPYKL